MPRHVNVWPITKLSACGMELLHGELDGKIGVCLYMKVNGRKMKPLFLDRGGAEELAAMIGRIGAEQDAAEKVKMESAG